MQVVATASQMLWIVPSDVNDCTDSHTTYSSEFVYKMSNIGLTCNNIRQLPSQKQKKMSHWFNPEFKIIGDKSHYELI